MASGDHQNVGEDGELCEVARLGMADAHGGVTLHQHQRHRLADDVAGADHDDILAFDLDAFVLQQLDDAIRRARRKHGVADDEAADIVEMEAIHILVGGNGLQHLGDGELRR